MLRTRGRRDELRFQGDLCQSSSPKVYWGTRSYGGPSALSNPAKDEKIGITLTGEVPHLRVLPRARLCQDLARRNALQALGDVPVERIATAGRGGGGGR